MHIKGIIQTSALDYPGHLSMVLFTGGCNFCCPFCQNSELVLDPASMPDYNPQEVLDTLRQRKGFVDGLVISGGEPLLQPNLLAFLRAVQEVGCPVKLDTNGYRPRLLAQIIQEGLCDFVAMDIKAPLEKYAQAAGVPIDTTRIQASIKTILGSPLESEFRTTVVPGLVEPTDAPALASLVRGSNRYVLQQFRPDVALAPRLRQVTPYTVQILRDMANQLVSLGIPTTIRGI